MIYLDSSYLAKCYLPDLGYAQVRELAATDEGACCEIGRVEAASAFYRALREGRLRTTAYRRVCQQFDEDNGRNVWAWLPVTSALLQMAATWFEKLGPDVFLRAGDAVHLACAAEHGFREIYSNDKHLLAAAPRFGLKGMNVISSR